MKINLAKLTAFATALAITVACMPLNVGAMATKGSNIIANNNPGFEDGALGGLWTESDQGTDSVSITQSSDQKHSGTYSALISNRDNNNDGPHITVDVEANTDYYISAWVRPAGSKKGRGAVRMVANGGADIAIPSYVDFAIDDWTQTSAVVNTGNNTSVRLRIHTNTVSNDTYDNTAFYVDDFEIRKVTTPPEIVVEGNLVINPGFENGTSENNYKDGWRTNGPAFTAVNSVYDSNTGKYAAKTVSRASNAYPTSCTPQQFVNIAADTYYYAGVMVRQASASNDTVKAIMRLQQDATGLPEGTSFTEITRPDNYTSINEIAYTKVAAVFYNKDATQAKIYVNTNETESTGYADLWTDDYVLLPITSSIPNGAADVVPNSDITLTVPEDIAVTTGTVCINNGAKIKSISRIGKTCVIHLKDMSYKTQYSLTLNTGLNLNPQWNFTTAEGMNLLTDYDSGFENGAIDTAKWNLSGASGTTTNTRTDAKAHSGLYSVFSSGRTLSHHGPQALNINLEKNAKYYVSAWVYTDAEGEKAAMRLQGADDGGGSMIDLAKGNWTQVTRVITANNTSAKAYVTTQGTSDIYVDDFLIYRIYRSNLITNPGFETGELGNEWAINNPGGSATVEVTDAECHSGKYSALVSSRTDNNDGPQITVPVDANTHYYISAWVKPKDNSKNGRGTIRLIANSQDGSYIELPTYTDFVSGQWTYIRAVVNTGTNTSVNLRIHTNTISNDTYNNQAFYVDDFEMLPCSAEGIIDVNPDGISSADMDVYLWDFACKPGTAHILQGWQVQTVTKQETVACNYYSLKPQEADGLTSLDIKFAGASIATAKDKPMDIDADKYKYISIKAQNNSDGNKFIVGFSANSLPETYYEFDWPDAEGVQEIILDMADCPEWTGSIDSLVFYPAPDSDCGSVILDSISVLGEQQETTDDDSIITRSEFIRMLTYSFGFINYYTNQSGFSDVAVEEDHILTAVETGIITEGGSFNPDGNITREQAASMLMNACTYLDKQSDRTLEAVEFDDASAFSSGILTPAIWVSGLGIMSLQNGNNFNPQGEITNKEACEMINRAVSWSDGAAQNGTVFVSAPVAGTYDIVRLTAQDTNGGNYANPYDYNEVKADAVFTAPDGSTLVIPGYFDMMRDFEYDPRRRVNESSQNSQWKFRFAPTMPGQWSFEIRLTQNGNVTSLGSGQITAVDSGKPGFIRADENNPRFIRDNGEAFNGFGINTYGPKGTDGANFIVHERYFKNYAQDNGTNLWRIWFENLTRGLETYVTGIGKLDNAFAQELDYTMLLARQNGVAILPSIKTHQSLVDGGEQAFTGPYMITNGGPLSTGSEYFTNAQTKQGYKNLLRFIVARYSAYDNLLLWELWNEEEAITGWRDCADAVSAWHDEMLAYLAEIDPYGHMAGSSGKTIAGESMLFSKEATDYTAVHSYNMVQPALMIRADAALKREKYGNKPNVIEELSLRQELFDSDKDGSITHETLWSSIAAGNAAATPSWWWESWMEKNEHWNIFGPVAGFIKDLNWPDENLELVNLKTTSTQKGDFIIPAGYYYPEQYDYDNLPVKNEFGTYDLTSNTVRDVTDVIYETHLRKGDFYTFNVNLPQSANFVVATVGSPVRNDANGTLEIYVDPEYHWLWGTLQSDPTYTKDITVDEYITKHRVSIPAGNHTIKIRNNHADGQSFYLGWVAFEDAAPRIAAEGAVGDNSAVIYVRDTKTVYSEMICEDYTPVEITDATIDLDLSNLSDGTYNLVWWDTYEGSEVSREEITISDGTASVSTVQVPSFTKDIAAKIVPAVAPELTSADSGIVIDNSALSLAMTEAVTYQFADMDAVKNVITTDIECTLTVNDNDANGYFSDGDTVVATVKTSDVSYTYTVDVQTKIDTELVALTVNGESEDFGTAVTKTGNAQLTYRVTNNMLSSITPVAVAVLYDADNRMLGSDFRKTSSSVATGAYTDFTMELNIPGEAAGGRLEILVWENFVSLSPLKRADKYIISVE